MKQKEKDMDEEQILKFWKQKKIYEKSVKKNKKPRAKTFYMMDGPPYASGHIHMGTALNKILKDIAMRSHRLQGFDVFDRAGYDTHGVPIEFQVEKEIGGKTKQDIEKFGIKKFIGKCKKYATRFIDVMNSEFENLGVWMDFKNPYLTLTNKYVETIWDTFKVADKKGLLYLDKYPVHICPRCETAVSYNEIEYAKQEDTSVFIKFALKNKPNTYLLIWTTTPWTLPGNTGVMVNPDFAYQEIELSNHEKWIIAKTLVPKITSELKASYTVKKEYKGKNMKNWEYINPLSKNLKIKIKNAYKVVLSKRYVTDEEGTGLVHCAPGHGKEDYEVGKENHLDMPSPVNIRGILTQKAGKYAGKKVGVVDQEIIRDLEKDNALVQKIKYTHDYPLCWRCKTPLLMISQPQWFLKISKIHSKLLQENQKTNWVPPYMKLRMKAWLEGISDWPISRKRYWGTPLPIWKCGEKSCGEKIVIGSIKELEKLSAKKIKDVHKPEIDSVIIPCHAKGCRGKMKRINEVLDVWFDAGVSSWAALETQKNLKKYWPADFNTEGKDQIRGWWNSQLILSQIKFGKKPFENIMVHGMVLDLEKRKMSKSFGNITPPQRVIKKYSRDYLRYYFTKISKGEDFAFDEKEFKDIQSAFRVLVNINSFVNQLNKTKKSPKIEDKWILSKFNSLIKQVTEDYNNFKFTEVVQKIENFLINNLSKTYIQIIRERADETYSTLNEIRLGFLILLAPIIPFTTEKIWQGLKQKKIVKEESIHLTNWPKSDSKKINRILEGNMYCALWLIEKGLAERGKEKIGLKWPLAKATITYYKKLKEQEEIIKRQLNIKKIVWKEKTGEENWKVKLDTKLTPALEAEGYAREVSRFIQAQRKKAGLVKTDKINLEISGEMVEILKGQGGFVKQRVNAKAISFEKSKTKFGYSSQGKIKDKEFKISFNKI